MRYIFFLLALFFTNLEAKNQPNFVLILIDDLGLTDLEAFGGEIGRLGNIGRLPGDRISEFAKLLDGVQDKMGSQ